MQKVLIAAVASSLATGGVIAATGIAGSSDNSKKTSPPPTMAQALKDMEKKRDEHLSRVAKRLDISTDKLKDAIEKVRKAGLDEAVDAGRLTEAERDAILACQDNPLTCDRSNLPAFGGPGMHHRFELRKRGERGKRQMRREFRGMRDDFLADLAKELDIDVAKVRAAFRAERPKFDGRGPRGFHRGGPGGPGGPGMGGPGGPGMGGPGGPGMGGPPPGPPPGSGSGDSNGSSPGSFQAPAQVPGEPA